MIDVKPLIDETLPDAEQVVRARFAESTIDILHKVMRNPMRRVCAEAGDIAYEDGRPVCFQACILRRLYLGQEEFIGKAGGMTSSVEGASEAAFIDVRLAANKVRMGSRMGFGNSCNQLSASLVPKSKKMHAGSESCSRYLWRAIRPVECALYFIRRKLLKGNLPQWRDYSTLGSADWRVERRGLSVRRVMGVEKGFYDVLTEQQRACNRGVFCSRTAEEIDWIFGERIRSGEAVVLGAYRDDDPVGYILLRSDKKAKRWKIHDWFAAGNDKSVLEELVRSALHYLRQETPAMMLEVEGFPTWIQPVLKRYLPFVRKMGFNQFCWGTRDKELRSQLEADLDSPKSWFFGPYDGDECMS